MQFNDLLNTANFINTLCIEGYIRKDYTFRVNKKPFLSQHYDAL